MIGDPVNVTSRIEAQNKELNTKLLVSDDFLAKFPEGVMKRSLSTSVVVKGKEEAIKVHEITGFIEPDTQLEVQATLDLILKNEDEFARIFYEKLFHKAPDVQDLFKKNMLDQGRMLTHMLGGIIYSLSRPDYLILGLKSLGRQHKSYGVEAEHYPIVKEALLETIEEVLGDSGNYKIVHAWKSALELVIQSMQSYSH